MSALSHFFAMGGYAAFVWPAYAVALAVLGGLTAQSWRRYRASLRTLRQLEGGRVQRRSGTRR
jgi:heme exporter protein D